MSAATQNTIYALAGAACVLIGYFGMSVGATGNPVLLVEMEAAEPAPPSGAIPPPVIIVPAEPNPIVPAVYIEVLSPESGEEDVVRYRI